MEEKSKRFSLNVADWVSIGKGLLIAVGGTLLITAGNWLIDGTFDWQLLWTLECGAIGSIIVNFLRKLLVGPA